MPGVFPYNPGMERPTSEAIEVHARPSAYSLAELAERARGPLSDADAEAALVFGSYARGSADGYSDLDLVVVIETDAAGVERCRRLAPLLRALPVTVNLFVYTPDEFRQGLARGLGIFDAVAREGIRLYARS